MGNFKIIKKGYSQLEVDSYIEKLKNDYETRLSEQKDRIFYLKDELDKLTKSSDNDLMSSLVSAVERAKIIENSSKNIYELETKKINLLYSKMENILNSNEDIGLANLKQQLLALINDCKITLQSSISLQNENIKQSNFDDPVKKLLSKMINFNKSRESNSDCESEQNFNTKNQEEVSINRNIAFQSQNEKSFNKEQTKQEQIKIVQVKKQKVSEENLNEFDKFLSDENELNGANFENIMFANNQKKKTINDNYNLNENYNDYLPNESGFDLKEAVNPKDDLDEIMKAFDFYNDNKKKN